MFTSRFLALYVGGSISVSYWMKTIASGRLRIRKAALGHIGLLSFDAPALAPLCSSAHDHYIKYLRAPTTLLHPVCANHTLLLLKNAVSRHCVLQRNPTGLYMHRNQILVTNTPSQFRRCPCELSVMSQ